VNTAGRHHTLRMREHQTATNRPRRTQNTAWHASRFCEGVTGTLLRRMQPPTRVACVHELQAQSFMIRRATQSHTDKSLLRYVTGQGKHCRLEIL